MATLETITPDAQRVVHPLRDGATIGRHPRSDVVIPDRRISRSHAEVARIGEDWMIRDLGSANGIYLNGERVRLARLGDGDRLRLGQTVFTVSLQSEFAGEVSSGSLEADPVKPAGERPPRRRAYSLADGAGSARHLRAPCG